MSASPTTNTMNRSDMLASAGEASWLFAATTTLTFTVIFRLLARPTCMPSLVTEAPRSYTGVLVPLAESAIGLVSSFRRTRAPPTTSTVLSSSNSGNTNDGPKSIWRSALSTTPSGNTSVNATTAISPIETAVWTPSSASMLTGVLGIETAPTTGS